MRIAAMTVLSVTAAGVVVALTGAPAAAATVPTGAVSLESVNYPGRFVRHLDSLGRLDPVTAASTAQVKADATLTVVNGLASPGCYSFQTRSGLFLRHRDWRLRIDANTGDPTFRADATFCAADGDRAGTVSLVSYNYPSRRIRHRDFALWLDQVGAVADSSFRITTAWAPKTARNPVIPGLFADPQIASFGGRYYLYPTTDGYAGWAAPTTRRSPPRTWSPGPTTA